MGPVIRNMKERTEVITERQRANTVHGHNKARSAQTNSNIENPYLTNLKPSKIQYDLIKLGIKQGHQQSKVTKFQLHNPSQQIYNQDLTIHPTIHPYTTQGGTRVRSKRKKLKQNAPIVIINTNQNVNYIFKDAHLKKFLPQLVDKVNNMYQLGPQTKTRHKPQTSYGQKANLDLTYDQSTQLRSENLAVFNSAKTSISKPMQNPSPKHYRVHSTHEDWTNRLEQNSTQHASMLEPTISKIETRFNSRKQTQRPFKGYSTNVSPPTELANQTTVSFQNRQLTKKELRRRYKDITRPSQSSRYRKKSKPRSVVQSMEGSLRNDMRQSTAQAQMDSSESQVQMLLAMEKAVKSNPNSDNFKHIIYNMTQKNQPLRQPRPKTKQRQYFHAFQ